MSAIWKINGTSAATMGLRVVGGSFGTQRTSTATIESATAFDAPSSFTHGQSISISRSEGGTEDVIFQGKVASIQRVGEEEEYHSYLIEDAWAELESTIYQEKWGLGEGEQYFPRAVLGVNGTTGEPQTVGDQISAIVTYAASVGVGLQAGIMPTGEVLWPSEIKDMSCSEAIMKCLDTLPSWIPWIDHSTTPPTFNVTPIADMTTLVVDVSGAGDVRGFSETRRDDLLPASVRIIFEFATTIDGNVYRNAVAQKYPSSGPDGGPKTICLTVPLSGGSEQRQKSRIRVTKMPEIADNSTLAKNWIKRTYPHLADVPNEHFNITRFEKSLAADTVDHPEEISPQAKRLIPTSVDDLPNELLNGHPEDWMRIKVGWVNFSPTIQATVGASEASKAAIAKGTPAGRVVATDAISKLYKGPTQWAAADQVPEGIPQAIYDSFHSAYQYQGSVTTAPLDVPAYRQHGRKITISGGITVNAPIHSVSWDVDTGSSTIGFGPVPELAPADFIEVQRRARARNVTWWTSEERTSNKLGAENGPSAQGDSVGGYYQPGIVFEPASPGAPVAWQESKLVKNGAKFDLTLHPGFVREIIPQFAEGGNSVIYHTPKHSGNPIDGVPPPVFSMGNGEYLYLSYTTDKKGKITGDVTFQISSEVLKSSHYQPTNGDGTGGADGAYKVALGKLSVSGDTGTWTPRAHGYIDHWAELWTGKNLGDGSRVYKSRNSETDEFEYRTIKGRYALKQEEGTDKIELDFDAESTGGGIDVYRKTADEDPTPDGPAKFRTIRPLGSLEDPNNKPQIAVTEEDGDTETEGEKGTIMIRGNKAKGSMGQEPNILEWDDGLITTNGDIEMPGATGEDHDIVFELCGGRGEGSDPLDPNTWATKSMRLSIRGGLVSVNKSTSEVPWTAPITVLHYQDCCFIDDPANDDWRNP